jgi:hypothetical protein
MMTTNIVLWGLFSFRSGPADGRICIQSGRQTDRARMESEINRSVGHSEVKLPIAVQQIGKTS